MYIARILYPIHVLGPGERIGIWFDGCGHHCPGCSNPELWEQQLRYKTTKAAVMQLINHICSVHPIDGFTLTGGDPFDQPNALAQLLPELSHISQDILVYTGFEYETVADNYPELVTQIGVLIDGRYEQDRNTGAILRGSDNQKIRILNERLKEKYRHYLATAKNEIENFTSHDGVISVGIHRPGYEHAIDSLLREKGLENK